MFLSDAKWESASVGWGEVARNCFDRSSHSRDQFYLKLKGKFYRHGMYAHSVSQYTFSVGKQYKAFSATVGLRDGAHDQGSAVFTVKEDDRILYKSPVLRPGQSDSFRIDISDVSTLELTAEGGEGHVHNSWAIWCDPIVSR